MCLAAVAAAVRVEQRWELRCAKRRLSPPWGSAMTRFPSYPHSIKPIIDLKKDIESSENDHLGTWASRRKNKIFNSKKFNIIQNVLS